MTTATLALTTLRRLRNFVDGDYVEPRSERTSEVVDPSTGAAVAARSAISASASGSTGSGSTGAPRLRLTCGMHIS
jgi:hypothetical protein